MSNTKLPPLPEPTMPASLLITAPQNGIHGPLFTADQMRAYARAALQALEDEAEASIKEMIDKGLGQVQVEPLHVAPQPKPSRVPLTDKQINQITAEQWGAGLGAPYAAYRAYARAIEAAHGIKP